MNESDDNVLVNNDEQHIPQTPIQGANASTNSNSPFVQLEPHSKVEEECEIVEGNNDSADEITEPNADNTREPVNADAAIELSMHEDNVNEIINNTITNRPRCETHSRMHGTGYYKKLNEGKLQKL